jgi:hypothetical protein
MQQKPNNWSMLLVDVINRGRNRLGSLGIEKTAELTLYSEHYRRCNSCVAK